MTVREPLYRIVYADGRKGGHHTWNALLGHIRDGIHAAANGLDRMTPTSVERWR